MEEQGRVASPAARIEAERRFHFAPPHPSPIPLPPSELHIACQVPERAEQGAQSLVTRVYN
jgi:hypothetical protein